MSAPDLAQVLKARRDEIVTRFVAEVQKDLSPPRVSRSLLVDHIPTFLDEIVVELERLHGVGSRRGAQDMSTTARQHGEQRWTLGYHLEAVIREYGILRHCILDSAKKAGALLTIDEFDVLAKCLSVGVAEAVTEYVGYRDQELGVQRANLQFLGEAGELLSSSLDYRSTLHRLTGLVVPRLADWCAVHVEGDDIEDLPLAHVDDAKVETLRDLYRRFPLPSDSPHGYPHVARTGEPLLVPTVEAGFLEATAQSEKHLAMLRAIGSTSSMIVPLRVQGTVLGAMTLAYSDSGRHYDEADLVLATELARRAALAVDNARLYELSQKERSAVEAATRAKDELVAVVSHELRTPLNAMLGWMRLMRSGSLSEAKERHAFDVIERNAEALDRLVADLLDISRIITGKLRISPSMIDVRDVVEMAIEGVRPAADAKVIGIQADVDDESTVVRADGDRLQQVVWNLLANAVKFTPKGGAIRVQLRRVDSDVELVVQDNGSGIHPSFLPLVFDSFRQFDSSSSRTHGGLGIGLSVAKHIVELHGGTIEARSDGAGKGATFVVRLPVSPLLSTTPAAPRGPAVSERPFDASPPVGLEGIRVLVVDDETDARELVGCVLESCGIEVRLAGNVADALSALKDHTPDVIISDIGMPDEDGYILIRAIRTLPTEEKNIPVIALTAFSRGEDRTRALVAGFNMHMAKPVEPSTLVRAVAELARANRS